ncbi:hypothetical protein QYE76_010428 [Lolium multiflorum]|uniref:Retrotransposon gag domain-containing protein n=1 Tax=Lolium multiflorum TaxID=4521 RepID=A0AAD8TUZ1_LOLMU|nr:hypothetical protein QYE76_010428 [Lolium multiflorum]
MGKPRDTKIAILPSTTRKGTTLSTSAALDSPSVISKLVSPPQASNAGTSAESENSSHNCDDASAVLDNDGSLGSFLDATIAKSRQIENTETPNENAATPVNSPESVEYSSDDLDEDYVELDDDFIEKCNATTDARKIKKLLAEHAVRYKLSPDPKFATSPINIRDKDYDFSLDLSHIAIVEKTPFCGTEKESAVEHMTELSTLSGLFSDDIKMRTYFVAKIFPFSLKDDAKTWYNNLPPGSIKSPKELLDVFFRKYFPASAQHAALQRIYNFDQEDGEKLPEAWARFCSLIRAQPDHDLEKHDLLDIFYSGLTIESRAYLDSCAGCVFRKRTPDDAEELLAKIGRNHDDWSTPEPTPTPIVKKRGMIKLNDEDMREAKKSLKEKGIKPEDVKNLPPIEDLCEITPPSSMIEDPLYPEGHPKRVEQDSQLIKTSAPSKKKKKKHKNVVESSEPVNDPNSISISDAETESGNEHEEDNDKNDTPDKEEIEKEPEKPAKNKNDEGFIEPPSKRIKTSTILPNPAASEASAPAAAPTTQMSTASSLSKGNDIPSTAATAAPPPGKPDLRTVISSLEIFASQYTSLEVDKAQLQKEVKSSSSKLEGAIKMAAEARQEVDSLKEELEGLKRRLKDEEASRLTAEARVIEKDDLLRQSSLALLKADDIPVEALDKLPNNSPANALSMTLASHHLVEDLLRKGKGAMARMHLMIFPKIDQNKTLGQLIDAFAVNTQEVIEVFKRTSRTYGALLAFQLMMGHGFKADIEEMSKELPKEHDGQLVDLSAFKTSALKYARQLLELVFPVPAFIDDSSGACSEADRLQRMKDRIAQMEKGMRSTYALAAIIRKKNELAADAERYALAELHRATESLNFIALNPAEENKRIHERVNALTQLSSADEVFWKEHSKASVVAKFQDRVQQVHRFFNKCYKGLRVIWKTMFPLNAVPPTLLTLMSEFSNAKKIQSLVRAQLLAGARATLALVLARYPSADLLAIANAAGHVEPLYPKVGLPAAIIVERLEGTSVASEAKETPQE